MHSLLILTHQLTVMCLFTNYPFADPDGGCYLYDNYLDARGGIGLRQNELLPIDGASAKITGCDTFGVNRKLPIYQEIYNEGKGIFFANTGRKFASS